MTENLTIQELYDILEKFIDNDLGHLEVTVCHTGKADYVPIKNKCAIVCDIKNSLGFEI